MIGSTGLIPAVRESIAEVRDQGAGVSEQKTVGGGKMLHGDAPSCTKLHGAAPNFSNFLQKRVDEVCRQVRDLKAER